MPDPPPAGLEATYPPAEGTPQPVPGRTHRPVTTQAPLPPYGSSNEAERRLEEFLNQSAHVEPKDLFESIWLKPTSTPLGRFTDAVPQDDSSNSYFLAGQSPGRPARPPDITPSDPASRYENETGEISYSGVEIDQRWRRYIVPDVPIEKRRLPIMPPMTPSPERRARGVSPRRVPRLIYDRATSTPNRPFFDIWEGNDSPQSINLGEGFPVVYPPVEFHPDMLNHPRDRGFIADFTLTEPILGGAQGRTQLSPFRGSFLPPQLASPQYQSPNRTFSKPAAATPQSYIAPQQSPNGTFSIPPQGTPQGQLPLQSPNRTFSMPPESTPRGQEAPQQPSPLAQDQFLAAEEFSLEEQQEFSAVEPKGSRRPQYSHGMPRPSTPGAFPSYLQNIDPNITPPSPFRLPSSPLQNDSFYFPHNSANFPDMSGVGRYFREMGMVPRDENNQVIEPPPGQSMVPTGTVPIGEEFYLPDDFLASLDIYMKEILNEFNDSMAKELPALLEAKVGDVTKIASSEMIKAVLEVMLPQIFSKAVTEMTETTVHITIQNALGPNTLDQVIPLMAQGRVACNSPCACPNNPSAPKQRRFPYSSSGNHPGSSPMGRGASPGRTHTSGKITDDIDPVSNCMRKPKTCKKMDSIWRNGKDPCAQFGFPGVKLQGRGQSGNRDADSFTCPHTQKKGDVDI